MNCFSYLFFFRQTSIKFLHIFLLVNHTMKETLSSATTKLVMFWVLCNMLRLTTSEDFECVAKDNLFGHYYCIALKRVCRNGWTDTTKHCLVRCTGLSDISKVDCGFHGIDQTRCQAKGCCWQESTTKGIPWCFNGIYMQPPSPQKKSSPVLVATLKTSTPQIILPTASISRMRVSTSVIFSSINSAHVSYAHYTSTLIDQPTPSTPIIQETNASLNVQPLTSLLTNQTRGCTTKHPQHASVLNSTKIIQQTPISFIIYSLYSTASLNKHPKLQTSVLLNTQRADLTKSIIPTTSTVDIHVTSTIHNGLNKFLGGKISESSFFIIISLAVVLVFFIILCIILYNRNEKTKSRLQMMYDTETFGVRTSDRFVLMQNGTETVANDIGSSQAFENPAYDSNDNFCHTIKQ